jgi:hypothetical protein
MVAIILLVVVLGIVVGYAARQREELHEHADRIESLLLENENLRRDNKAHESSMEMLLVEIDKSA